MPFAKLGMLDGRMGHAASKACNGQCLRVQVQTMSSLAPSRYLASKPVCEAPRRSRSLSVKANALLDLWPGKYVKRVPKTVPPSETGTTGNGASKNGKQQDIKEAELAYLTARTGRVTQHFPSALGVDDFIARLEIALYAYGFSGENSIAMSNLCRDEITVTLKNKIDQTFGSSFNTNGLGGVLTCGVTGVKAGLSHSPVATGSGKERYVFLSFPHISVDARGEVGAISRPGRPGQSCACGALFGALGDMKRDGLAASCRSPGVHDPLDPEYTILKQRLARRLRFEGASEDTVQQLGLVDMTKIAERTITDDLEYLISNSVDPAKADYAVVTGIQIHSWGSNFDGPEPNLEFVAPTSVYVVVEGERTDLDLSSIPPMTPRQIRMMALQPDKTDMKACALAGSTTVRAIDPPYEYASGRRKLASPGDADYISMLQGGELSESAAVSSDAAWQSNMKSRTVPKNMSSIDFDIEFNGSAAMDNEGDAPEDPAKKDKPAK